MMYSSSERLPSRRRMLARAIRATGCSEALVYVGGVCMQVGRSVIGLSWRLRRCDGALALAISQRHGVPEVVGRVLAGRGVQPAEAAAFLSPRLKDWLPDPS